MTTRDPRSRPTPAPLVGRDPTQSLSIEPDESFDSFDGEPSHPSLALGTHDAQRSSSGEERTRVESPSAQRKPVSIAPASRPPSNRPPPVPARLDDVGHHVGQTLGSYKILELLGKGGMGYVFRAEHVKLGREVALKLLRSDYARRRDAVARFFQEARTVNRVRHRNIVDVTDFVELDDGTTFIIMELLAGQSLGKWARTGIDLPRALAVLVQICDGLGAAHSVSVVHRDLKPDNIIVIPTSDGAELVKLLDFGVAKLLNRDDEDVGFQTAAGSVIGTPAYMSPEQAGGMIIDARSDIYSLGAIMYELFCGQAMFRGRSFGEYVRKHLTEMPLRPSATQGGAHIDPRLEALIWKCLEKDPNMRFGSIVDLRDALLGMLGSMETHPPSLASLTASGMRPPPMQSTYVPHAMQTVLPQPLPTPGSGMHPSLFYSQYASQIVPPPPQPTTPWWVWFVGGAIAVALGVGAAVWYAGRGETEPLQTQVPPLDKPVVKPTITPEPAPVEQPKLVEIKLDSLPSGGVYADGHSAELCRTPCTFNVDLGDGGPGDHRTYVVRADGYKDMSVVVDFTSAKRTFDVTLEQLEAGQSVPADRVDRIEKQPRTNTKIVKKPVTKPTDKPADKPADKPVDKPADKPGDPDHLIDPTDGHSTGTKKPTTTKKPEGIDPTDLKDPFKKKK